jgi:hypothetical protein
MSNPAAPAPLSIGQQVQEQIAQLQAALLSAQPNMPTLLRTIHTALRQDSSIVTLLSPEEVGTLVAGLMKQTNTVIATSAVKGSSGKKAKLAAITLEDL